MNKKWVNRIKESSVFYWLVLVLLAAAFFFWAFQAAHLLPSRLDEGSFLIKGYYYLTGRYAPFEDYGPWTNNMPMAYYIPGLAQALFGPGLRAGRYFAIFLTILNLIGLWFLVYRLKGKWWALFAMAVIALNPAVIRIYSQAISQGLVACLVTWMLFFLIGLERKTWQIAAGAFLGALAILTRQNMIFLLPFILVYAFWLHGKKAGWLAVLFSLLPLAIVHMVFYPKIMALWYAWFPGFLKRALGVGLVSGGGTQVWSPETGLITRLTSFFIAFRYHFLAIFGTFLLMLILPVKAWWQDQRERKTAFLLVLLFGIFFAMHAWASLSKDYCVYCFPNYITFFLPIGLLAAVYGFSQVIKSKSKLNLLPVMLFLLLVVPGLFLGSAETVGRWVMAWPFPRFKNGWFVPGNVPLWSLFSNRFGLTHDSLLFILPPVIGGLLFLVVCCVSVVIYRLLKLKNRLPAGNYLAALFLFISLALSPTLLFANDRLENTCGGDVLAAYEQAGARLAASVSPGSSIYWSAGSVVTPLLYIADADIHPPQLNGIYSARKGGDRDLLEKAGYYNEASRITWRESDEYFLISYTAMGDFWKEFFNSEDFNEYQPTAPVDPCDPDSSIRIFKRK